MPHGPYVYFALNLIAFVMTTFNLWYEVTQMMVPVCALSTILPDIYM